MSDRTTVPRSLTAALRSNPALLARVQRMAGEPPADTVTNPAEAIQAIWPLLVGRETEAVVVVALDRRGHVIEAEVLTTGSDAFTVVCPRQIYRWALTRSRPCASLVLSHNHPSGDVTPSAKDYEATERVCSAGRTLDLPLQDHLILATGPGDDGSRYLSMREQGYW